MSDAKLRRWLVPCAALASIAVPVLMGACFDAEAWEYMDDCDDCAECQDVPFGKPWVGSPIPEDELPQLPPPLPGEEEASGYVAGQQPQEDTGGGASGETPPADVGEAEEPPVMPNRPRIPDGVLVPRPDPSLRPPTQSPSQY